jgi:pyruvate,orthophosphate dikinase
MLGFRGRLSVIYPEITEMKVEAIARAAVAAQKTGYNPYPEIMIPLIVNVREIRAVTGIVKTGILKVLEAESVSFPYKIGIMIETLCACFGTKRLANAVKFMSFGTNDLTQMTYGFSRDDMGKFIPAYLDRKLVESDLLTAPIVGNPNFP